MLTIYGIPNCDTVKKTRKWFEAKGIEYVFVNYKTEGADASKIKGWLEQIPLSKMFNKSSATWKSLSDEEKATTEDSKGAIKIMVELPSIIKRPIVEDASGKVLAVGFKEADYEALF